MAALQVAPGLRLCDLTSLIWVGTRMNQAKLCMGFVGGW